MARELAVCNVYLSFACECTVLEVLIHRVSAQIPVCPHSKAHVHKTPHPLPQTHMNPESTEVKEINHLTMFHKENKCTGYPLWVNASQVHSHYPPSITSYCFSDYYWAMISEGAVKTASTGSSGNWLGSPTFSPPKGGFLTGEIIQHDGNTGQARGDIKEMDGLG